MIAGSWDPYVTRVQETAGGLWHAGDATDLLERSLQTIAAAEVVRDLALLSARDQDIPWTRLAEITGTTPNGVKHQHQRAAEQLRAQPQNSSSAAAP